MSNTNTTKRELKLFYNRHIYTKCVFTFFYRLVSCVEYGTKVKLYEVTSTVQNVLDADFQAV